jgi:hypothetical protein
MSIRTYRVTQGSVDEALHRVDRDLAEAFMQRNCSGPVGSVAVSAAVCGERA